MKKINLVDFASEIKASRAAFQTAFDRVLKSGWFILGYEVKKFEQEYAQFLGVKHCIGVANGLEALQISLMALGIGEGDEILTTPVSAVATTLAIIAVGATPVFVDVDENGLLNTDLLEKAITKKTKVILPVHLYGNSVDLKKIQTLCKKYQLFLVEDACQAHGATYSGKRLGTFGEFGCFSFYPTKNLGAFGDGGAIVTNNSKLAGKCYQFRDYGQTQKYIHSIYGLNSRLDELQAAFLRVKLKKLGKYNLARQELVKRYQAQLTDVSQVKMITPTVDTVSNYHQLVIRTNKRDQLREFLRQNGVSTDIHYPLTIPDQPFLAQKKSKIAVPDARRFVNEIISLPIHPFLKNSEVDWICKLIKDFFKKGSPFLVKVYQEIPDSLIESVNTFKKTAYQGSGPAPTTKQIQEHDEKFCSQKDIAAYLLVFEDKEVVGGLKIMERQIPFQSDSILLGGLAGVWTRVDKQKQGVAQLMIRQAMQMLQKDQCDIAYLCTELDKLESFYQQFGFQKLGRMYTFLGKSGKRYFETNGMIAPISSPKIFKKILKEKAVFDIGRGNW